MISKQQIAHKLQIILTVSQIHIEIRFPCKLQIGIKIGKQENNLNEEVELKSGLATFSETLKVETFMVYDGNARKYLQKKATITVYVVSPRGKNVAGVFPLDLSLILNRTNQEQTFANQALQRCPDKEATISLKVKGYLLQELADANISLASDRSGIYLPPPNKVSSSINDRPKVQSRYPPTPKYESNQSQKRPERNLSQSHNNKRSFVEQITPIQNRLIIQNRSEYVPKVTYKEDPSTANENFKLKSRIDELQREVESLKRQLVEKKRLQNEVDALNYKISQLQKVISGNRLQIDSTNKQKRRGTQEYTNKIEELQKLNLTLQKRVDIKSSFYKEELEKYNAKLLSIENQKQQLILQISSLKDENFDLNRKINALKDKEKLLNDDKIKLTKRIEEFRKQPTTTEKQSTLENSGKDVMYERLKQTISNNELEKLSLMDQLEKLKNQVLNEGIFRTKYENQLKEKNSVIQQKLYLENQHALTIEESTNQANRLNKQLSEKIDEVHLLNSKIVEITSKNKLQVARLLEQYQTLKSTLEFVRGTEEKGRNEYEQLTVVAQDNHRLLLDSNKRCASLESALKESQLQCEQLKKNLKSSTEQGRNLNHQIQKLKSIISDFQNQITVQSETKRKNEEEFKSIIQKLQQNNKQHLQQIALTQQQLFSTKAQLEQQENNFTDEIERKEKMIREKQVELRTIYQDQTQLQMKNAGLESRQAELKEIVRALQGQVAKQRKQIENWKKNNYTVQQSQTSLKLLLADTKNNLEQKEQECQSLIESNKILDSLLTANRNDYEKYKDNMNEHIHGLLKSLVTRNKVDDPIEIVGLSQGLVKLQTDVITKVRGCYQQLQVVSQKLLNKEMQQITSDQNNNLQIQTLQIQLGQIKKQLQTSKDENLALISNLENNKGSYIQESLNLKNQMTERELQLNQQFSLKSKQASSHFDKQLNKLKEQHSKEKTSLETKLKALESQLTNLQKELYDQYNEVNVISLKNYENLETIKELEDRLLENNQREGFFESDRNKFISDIMYLEQQLNKLSQMYEELDRNLFLALEREAILTEENEYLRGQFETKTASSTNRQFEQREKNVVQMHRATSQNSKLSEIIHELQLKLGERETVIKILQDNVKSLGIEIEEKYKIIYNLENEIKLSKGKLRDHSRSRQMKDGGDRIRSEDRLQINNKLRELSVAINQLIANPPNEIIDELIKLSVFVEALIKPQEIKEVTIRTNFLMQ